MSLRWLMVAPALLVVADMPLDFELDAWRGSSGLPHQLASGGEEDDTGGAGLDNATSDEDGGGAGDDERVVLLEYLAPRARSVNDWFRNFRNSLHLLQLVLEGEHGAADVRAGGAFGGVVEACRAAEPTWADGLLAGLGLLLIIVVNFVWCALLQGRLKREAGPRSGSLRSGRLRSGSSRSGPRERGPVLTNDILEESPAPRSSASDTQAPPAPPQPSPRPSVASDAARADAGDAKLAADADPLPPARTAEPPVPPARAADAAEPRVDAKPPADTEAAPAEPPATPRPEQVIAPGCAPARPGGAPSGAEDPEGEGERERVAAGSVPVAGSGSLRFELATSRLLVLGGLDFEPRQYSWDFVEPPTAVFAAPRVAARTLEDLAGALRTLRCAADVVRRRAMPEAISQEHFRWLRRLEMNRAYHIVEKLVELGVDEELVTAKVVESDSSRTYLQLYLSGQSGAPCLREAAAAKTAGTSAGPALARRVGTASAVLQTNAMDAGASAEAAHAEYGACHPRRDRGWRAKCPYEGCDARGLLAELAEHVRHCEHRSVPCPREGCGVEVKANELAWHVEHCPNAIQACAWDGCGRPIRAIDTDSHRKQCPHRLVACPFDGCGKQVKASVLHPHKEMCPHRLVVCPLNGCGLQLKACALQSHREECVSSRGNVAYDHAEHRLRVLRGLEFTTPREAHADDPEAAIGFKDPAAAKRTLDDIADVLASLGGAEVCVDIPPDTKWLQSLASRHCADVIADQLARRGVAAPSARPHLTVRVEPRAGDS